MTNKIRNMLAHMDVWVCLLAIAILLSVYAVQRQKRKLLDNKLHTQMKQPAQPS